MRILFINNYHYLRGGSERVFFNEMDLLRKNGHDVSAFSRKTSLDIESKNAKYFPDDIQTEKVSVSWTALKTIKEISYSATAREAITALLETATPDLVHAHNIYGRLTTSVLDAVRKKSIPAVMTVHDYKLICPNYKLFCNGSVCEACRGKSFYHAVLKKCHKDSRAASAIYAAEAYFSSIFGKYKNNLNFLITPSRFLKNKLVESCWPDGKIAYIPNFIKADSFNPEFTPGDYLLYIGRLSAEKGLSTLIKAFKKLKPKELSLKIVGEGPLKKQLEQEAGSNHQIQFAGYLSGEALQCATAGAMAVVVPSEWYENAPLSVIESFACGKPVVGADIGGIPEMIEDGVNGFLFEPGDAMGLRDTLDRISSLSKNDIQRIGEAARQKVESQYNADLHYELLMEVYKSALQ